jgi:hypothetical protein
LVREVKANRRAYYFGASTWKNSDNGSTNFSVPTGEEQGDGTAPERDDAMAAYLKRGAPCNDLVVHWLPEGSSGNLVRELRTILGGRNRNQVVIQAETTARAVDYVTDQLRHFAE